MQAISKPWLLAASPFHFFLALLFLLLLPLVYYYSLEVFVPRDFSPWVPVTESWVGDHYSPYVLLLRAALLVPASHYALALSLAFLAFLYNFLEVHLLHDVLATGFRGDSVQLSFHPRSELYDSVVSKCRILHGRYMATPWLSSPHLQTAFLGYLGGNPVISYKREIYRTQDGGTIALDWLRDADGLESVSCDNGVLPKGERIPIVIVVPGITSDSDSSYIKHLAFKISKRAWNVCVVNHRGFGGISITSDCFYNAGWTEDIRSVTQHLHSEYPEAPLYAVGISVGANILVKYLGEDGINVPVVGAAAICSPWDNLIFDRFMNRGFLQKLYSKAIASSLKRYAERHQSVFSRLADWDGISKSRLLREFDQFATHRLGKYKTVDTYYRCSSSANVVGSISVPLLSISALDDPVCPMEAIPWDECRENENIILATTTHGGHVAYYEGLTADSLWWVRAVDEFLSVLDSSKFVQRRKMPLATESSNDLGSVVETELVKASGDEPQNIQF